MKQAKLDPIGDAREQRRLLDLIPEPDDEAFSAAVRAALVHARIRPETIAVLEAAKRRRADAVKKK